MIGDTSALGDMTEDKGQAEDLQKLNPKADIVVDKETSKETKAPEKKQETETLEEKTAGSHSEDEGLVAAELKKAKDALAKAKDQLKDKESFIGKQSAEVGRLKNLETRILDATTATEKNVAKDELMVEAESIKGDFIKQGYTEAEAEAAVKPYLRLVNAADKRRVRVQLETTFQEQLKDIPHLVRKSGKINPEIFDTYTDEIYAELEKLDPVWRSRNLSEAVLKSYKNVIREKADEKRQVERTKQNAEREAIISAQVGTGPKGAEDKAEDYDADSIASAGTGNIFGG